MIPSPEEEFQRKFRLILSRVRYSYHMRETGDPMVSCSQHGSTAAIAVRRPGFPGPDKICPKCFCEQFPEIREAPTTVRVLPEIYDCFVDGCPNKIDYHSTCVFCGKHVCAAHSDQSYCCFACLQDEENQCGSVKKNTSERGS